MSGRGDEAFGDDVYQENVDGAEYLDGAETLATADPDEVLDTSWSPPEREPASTRYGTTEREQAEGESLDQRLAEEEPDVDASTWSESAQDPRAGRLVASGEGVVGERRDGELVADDVGIAGSAASAEEAAVHVRTEDQGL
ncbi:MAG: DUF5709 domain-containing protein [Actinomycetota bacterium]|nr:DUF5709 domain-containing protein [Actinomycetota bacterium]